jgi:microcystin-dependent protein
MTGVATLLPNGKQQFIDQNGVPLIGGFVYFYIPNTTTFKTTWVDPEQATPNSNPVVLDSRGQAIIYGEGQYRQQVYDSNDNLIWDQLTASTDYGLLQAANNLSDLTNPAEALVNLGAVSLAQVYPVGSIYMNASNSANPATLFGFGTWTAFGAGLVPVGVGTGTDSNSLNQTFTAGTQVGEYAHTLLVTELASHNHSINDPSHYHQALIYGGSSIEVGSGGQAMTQTNTSSSYTGITINYTGSNTAHNNVQPSIPVYMWLRTA